MNVVKSVLQVMEEFAKWREHELPDKFAWQFQLWSMNVTDARQSPVALLSCHPTYGNILV